LKIEYNDYVGGKGGDGSSGTDETPAAVNIIALLNTIRFLAARLHKIDHVLMNRKMSFSYS
jgi:hypothetical protein